jgi:hypothetical protein
MQNLTVAQLVKKFNALSDTRRFIAVFTKVPQWNYPKLVESNLTFTHYILSYTLKSSFHLHLGIAGVFMFYD